MKQSSALTMLFCITALATSISNGAERTLSAIIDQLSWRPSDPIGDDQDDDQYMNHNRKLVADFEAGLRAKNAACPRMRSKALLLCSSQGDRQCCCLECGVAGSCLTCCTVIATHRCTDASYYALPAIPCLAGALCGMANAQPYSNYFYAPVAKLLCCLCCKTASKEDSHQY